MKIKVEKKMNLHELIKWAWENDIKAENFFVDNSNTKIIRFDIDGDVSSFEDTTTNILLRPLLIKQSDTFTVETGEEITEETVIPNLLEVYEYDRNLVLEVRKNKSIKELLDSDDYDGVTIKAFHIINDDGTHTLIWKDGEMVE